MKKVSKNKTIIQTPKSHETTITTTVMKIDEYTVFNAIRDNKGKGIKATDLKKILEDSNS